VYQKKAVVCIIYYTIIVCYIEYYDDLLYICKQKGVFRLQSVSKRGESAYI